jgi:hypothetical protein
MLIWVVADRGYTSHALREHIWNQGSRAAIPTPGMVEGNAFNPVACPA